MFDQSEREDNVELAFVRGDELVDRSEHQPRVVEAEPSQCRLGAGETLGRKIDSGNTSPGRKSDPRQERR